MVTLSIEENDEIEVLFESDDKDAKLYLEALDIVPLDDKKLHMIPRDIYIECQVQSHLFYIK